MSWNRPTAGRAMRNDFGIVGYVGANGGGKTAAAIWDSMPSLDAGRPVLSTVRILDYTNPRLCDDEECACDKEDAGRHMAAHPGWVKFTDWVQLHEWAWGDVIMDEVSGVASSRGSHSMPGEIEAHLQQLRKGDTVVRWTAPSWKRADVVIRECSQLVVSCRGFIPKSPPALEGELQRRWKQRRLFVWRTFDANQFEDFTAGTRERLKPLGSDWHWGPGSAVFSAYDTYQKAFAIGATNEHGKCMVCGGRRSVPVCKGHDEAETVTPPAPVAGSPLAGGRRSPAVLRLKASGS